MFDVVCTKTHYRNLASSDYQIILVNKNMVELLFCTVLLYSVLSRELFDDRYVVYRGDRKTTGIHDKRKDSGVLIAVSDKINSIS